MVVLPKVEHTRRSNSAFMRQRHVPLVQLKPLQANALAWSREERLALLRVRLAPGWTGYPAEDLAAPFGSLEHPTI